MYMYTYVFHSWDTSKVHQARSIEDIKQCASTRTQSSSNTKESYGVKYQPLLPVELDHVVPDELHLLLRIIDVLLENIINQAVESDIKVCRKQADLLQGAILKKLVSKIQSCGVSFYLEKKRISST